MLVLGFEEFDRAFISLARMSVEQFLAVRDQPIVVSLEQRTNTQRIGFDAPKCIDVDRESVYLAKRREMAVKGGE